MALPHPVPPDPVPRHATATHPLPRHAAIAPGDETVRRVLVAVGSALATAYVLMIATGAVSALARGESTDGLLVAPLFLLVYLLIPGAVVAVPVTAAAMWVLSRSGPGRWPRILVGAGVGLCVVLAASLIGYGALWLESPGAAFVFGAVPVLSGAVGGAVVGPRRPRARARRGSSDEDVEDALLDG